MNVVVHAYPDDEPGLLEVEAIRGAGGPHRRRPRLRHGDPAAPRRRPPQPADRPDPDRRPLQQLRDQGRRRPRHRDPHAPAAAARATGRPRRRVRAASPSAAAEETEMRVGHAELVGPILSRALGALAARREITVDRLSDAMLLCDAISAGAPQGFADGHVSPQHRRPRARASSCGSGPMEDGGAERLRAEPRPAGGRRLAGDAGRRGAGRAATSDGEFLVVGIAALSPASAA